MSLGDAAAKGAKTTLIGQWLRFAVQFSAMVVLARILTPADFGQFAMVVAIVGVATLLGDFGLSMAAIQSKDLSRAQSSNLFWINLAIGVVTGTAVFLLSGPISLFYGREDLAPVVRALSTVFVLQAATAQFSAIASRHLKFVALAIADVSAQALGLIIAVAIALLGGGIWALVAQQIAIAGATLIAIAVASRWAPGLPRRAPMKSFLGFGTNALGVQLLSYVSSNVDSVVLGRLWGATALGFYDRAYQIFRLPIQQIASPMTRVALPILSRVNDDDAIFNGYLARAQLILSYVIGGVFFFAAACARPIVDIVLGPQWAPSADLLSILAIGGVFQAFGYVYYWAFLAKAKTGLQLRFTVFTRSLSVVLILVGAIWGSVGVATGVTAGLIANWVVLSLFAMPRTGVDVRSILLTTARPLSLFTIIVGLTFLVGRYVIDDMNPYLQLSALVLAIAVLMGIGLLSFPWLRRDLATVLHTARRAL